MIDQAYLVSLFREYGLAFGEQTAERLDAFATFLVQRNQEVNLTAITQPEEICTKHLLDSLLIFKYVTVPQAARVIDVGCGAGFPSLPMLIAREDLNITFLDSTKKKLTFIEDTLDRLHLNGTTLHARAEEQARNNVSRETFDIAVARAVANLSSLCELTLPFVKVGGFFVAMKGKEGAQEQEAAENAIQLLGGKTEAVHRFTLPDGSLRYLIVIKKISQTPTRFPRSSTAILKKPLS